MSTWRVCVLALMLSSLGACQDAALTTPVAPSASAGIATDASPAASYTIEDLGVLPGSDVSVGERLNSAGDVAGQALAASGNYHAVLWIGTTPLDLGTPFGTSSQGIDVNDSRAVAGMAYNLTSTVGFLWKGGTFTLITRPTSPQNIQVSAINNSDVVVGSFKDPGSFNGHAFRFTKSGGLTDIHPAGNYVGSGALGISDEGTIVGLVETPNFDTHLARWAADGSFTDLGDLGGGYAVGRAINDVGTIVGDGLGLTGGDLPFVWRSPAGFTPGPRSGIALDVTNLGRVAGAQYTARSNVLPVTRLGNGPFEQLPLLTGGANASAEGVNRCGVISGWADNGAGNTHAVRWRPLACD